MGSGVPAEFPGRSFLQPIIETKARRPAIPIESEIGHAIVGERYKRCVYFQGEPGEQWFDLETDPGEMQSIPASDVPEEARQRLLAAYEEQGLFERA